ncbi:hypothetical protein PFICI_06329 [Pestalotiopsis fici W106-1]|uniref:AB hydrolase-1 domain-containing protein n=1 Tax=Pestalotiopsis fici (strain W106-1 / CGMCC3.15140) TaxID=1229662 RepID=W3X7G9_PESFW|nr:uncharacterized protein PFICI_06329 [Pestalotiopsis fici W106-1]ETS81327.1 hypothetical protein PFICI_06329 [Pestalotiopsis fici W106-1]
MPPMDHDERVEAFDPTAGPSRDTSFAMQRAMPSSRSRNQAFPNVYSTRSRGETDTSVASTSSSKASFTDSTWSLTSMNPPESSTEAESCYDDGPKELWFETRNPYAPVTVVMLHLLFSSHLEWMHVAPKLTEYHLLIPDLPHHSRSRHIKPFSFALAADLVVDMIKKHAHGGRAHLVGISTGGYVALEIARRHPEVVLSIMTSGSPPLRDVRLKAAQSPRLVHYGLLAALHSPNSVFFKLSGWAPEFQDSRLLKEVKRNTTSRLSQYGNRESAEFQKEAFEEAASKGIRVAMLAGGKQDDVEAIREAGRLFTGDLNFGDGLRSRSYIVREAIHAWNLQMPYLFAKGIQAWVEDWPLPPEFEIMD